ncbi:MAG: hypothetical protein LBG47_03375 [Prevotellaceae bacterium]|nr:hypothetical protein [Prevotellaceae bacterium]
MPDSLPAKPAEPFADRLRGGGRQRCRSVAVAARQQSGQQARMPAARFWW